MYYVDEERQKRNHDSLPHPCAQRFVQRQVSAAGSCTRHRERGGTPVDWKRLLGCSSAGSPRRNRTARPLRRRPARNPSATLRIGYAHSPDEQNVPCSTSSKRYVPLLSVGTAVESADPGQASFG